MSNSVTVRSDSPSSHSEGSSYGQILKSSSIAGGAQGISLILGMLRTKLAAILLGTGGVGLVGLYESTFGLVGTLTGLGIGQSAVRQVAEAHGTGEGERVGRTVRVLRRVCWLTGVLGMVLTAALSWPLSIWTFGDPGHAVPIAILGTTLLLTAVTGGQSALIRGVRRIGDLARMQVLSSLAALVIGVALYAWLGKSGIVPVFLATAAINLGFSWWFARRVTLPPAEIDWQITFTEGRELINLGLAFMISSLLGAGVALATRAWILKDFGIEANGLFQAAWGISGVFAGFILTAMGMDFYPRLTAAAKDNDLVNRLVNEQLEIGLLLALPGLLATVVFSHWIVLILYSEAFKPAADLLPWFVVGIFGRVVSWPMGFIQQAIGSARTFAVTQISFHLLHLILIWLGLHWLGLIGIAVAFACAYFFYILGILYAARILTNFRLTLSIGRLLIYATSALAGTLILSRLAPPWISGILGIFTVIVSGALCLRRICHRLGENHRIVRCSHRLPVLGGWILRSRPH